MPPSLSNGAVGYAIANGFTTSQIPTFDTFFVDTETDSSLTRTTDTPNVSESAISF